MIDGACLQSITPRLIYINTRVSWSLRRSLRVANGRWTMLVAASAPLSCGDRPYASRAGVRECATHFRFNSCDGRHHDTRGVRQRALTGGRVLMRWADGAISDSRKN